LSRRYTIQKKKKNLNTKESVLFSYPCKKLAPSFKKKKTQEKQQQQQPNKQSEFVIECLMKMHNAKNYE
jgi:type IV secretory pathway VirB9-like protein